MKKALMLSMALLLTVVGMAAPAVGQERLLEQARALFKPIPRTPPVLEGNPVSPAKVELGRMLYFDPRLSASQLISCQTCHNVGLAGTDLQETSVGHGWQKGPRNAPTVLNAVFNLAQFWDGRAADLAEQAKGPVQASVEMNNSPERVLETLGSIPEYRERFAASFPGEKAPLSFDNMAKAIEVFEATLLTPDAPFDRFLGGEAGALDEAARSGLVLFIEKGCASCHNGTNLGGLGYFPFGVVEKPVEEVLPPGDTGRFQVTNTAADRYVFRAPPLRNVALTSPYFHSGKVWKLRDAVTIMGSAQLGVELQAAEVAPIEAFLSSLSGVQPRVEHPVLPPGTDATPKPILGGGGGR